MATIGSMLFIPFQTPDGMLLARQPAGIFICRASVGANLEARIRRVSMSGWAGLLVYGCDCVIADRQGHFSNGNKAEMGTKPKVRFTVAMAGNYLVLFSVRERPGKGLLITPSGGGFYKRGDAPQCAIEEQHISIHPSQLSHQGSTTITLKTRLANGDRVSQATLVKGPRSDLMCGMFSASLSGLDSTRIVERDKDTVINVATCLEILTPVYHVFIAYKGCLFDHPVSKRFSKSIWDFDEYSIAVFVDFIPIPPTGCGAFVFFASSPLMKNGIYISSSIGNGVQPLKHASIPDILAYGSRGITELLISHFREIYSGEDISDIIKSIYIRTSSCLGLDLQ